MSLQKERQSCVVCKAYVFEEDDVVYCPTCGAPHHRECYDSVGRCALENLHGTSEQYVPPVSKKQENETSVKENTQNITHNKNSVNVCMHCMRKIDTDAKVCPYCGRPVANGRYFSFDLSGGVSDDTDLGGIKAGKVREFVVVNTRRYLPRFLDFKEGSKQSFNWFAFLIPQGWFLSRKMYKAGALVFTILLALQIFLFPLNTVLNQNVFTDYNEVMLYIMEYLNECLATGNYLPIIAVMIGTLGPVVLRIICGCFADKIYFKHVKERVKDMENSDLSAEEYNHKYGGVSILAGLIGIMAFNYLPNIIFMLF